MRDLAAELLVCSGEPVGDLAAGVAVIDDQRPPGAQVAEDERGEGGCLDVVGRGRPDVVDPIGVGRAQVERPVARLRQPGVRVRGAALEETSLIRDGDLL